MNLVNKIAWKSHSLLRADVKTSRHKNTRSHGVKQVFSSGYIALGLVHAGFLCSSHHFITEHGCEIRRIQ